MSQGEPSHLETSVQGPGNCWIFVCIKILWIVVRNKKFNCGQLRGKKSWSSLEPSKLTASLISLHAIYTHWNISRKDGCLSNQLLVLTGPEPAGAGHWYDLSEVQAKWTPSSSCRMCSLYHLCQRLQAVPVISGKITGQDRKQLGF